MNCEWWYYDDRCSHVDKSREWFGIWIQGCCARNLVSTSPVLYPASTAQAGFQPRWHLYFHATGEYESIHSEIRRFMKRREPIRHMHPAPPSQTEGWQAITSSFSPCALYRFGPLFAGCHRDNTDDSGPVCTWKALTLIGPGSQDWLWHSQ